MCPRKKKKKKKKNSMYCSVSSFPKEPHSAWSIWWISVGHLAWPFIALLNSISKLN